MIRFLRQARRLVLFGGLTAAFWLGVAITTPFARLFGYDARRYRARAVTIWARRSMRILGVNLSVQGSLPRPPFVLVTNHLGYIDVLVLSSQAPLRFVAKAEIARWPIFGALARAAGTLFIDRARGRDIPRVVREIEESFAGGVSVALFPEATSSPGAEVLRFRPSLLEAAAHARLPVVYAALTYRTAPEDPPAHLSVCWWNDESFPRHVAGLFALRAFDARLRFGSETVVEEDRKRLAERLHRGVSEIFEPVVAAGNDHERIPVS